MSDASGGQHASKRKLLDATLHVVRTKGYAAARIEDICDAAAVSRGSFFHHFKSKEDVAIAAADHWTSVTSAFFAQAEFHKYPDPLERLLGYLRLRRDIIRGEPAEFSCFVGAMVQDVHDSHPAIRAACEKSIAAHSAVVEGDISEALTKHSLEVAWTPHSLGMHIQAVLQGAFLLAKAIGRADVAVSSVDHLIRYVETLFQVAPRGTSTENTDATH
jgi:TetR/AcrR family transcriptional repressor of nem operon